MKRALRCACLLATLLCAVPALAQEHRHFDPHDQHHVPVTVDSGSFKIFRRQVELGSEVFTFVTRGDSLVISSDTRLMLAREAGIDTFAKVAALVVGERDYDLRSYQSQQLFQGDNLKRGLVVQDTALTTYLQVNQHGEGATLVRPPGRVFIMDSQVFVLYDVLCRNLYDKTFASRPVTLFSMGVADTVIEATAEDLGKETQAWGGRATPVRKLRIAFEGVEFFVWISDRGQMLRLEQPAYGLRIERQPDAPRSTKRAPAKRSPPKRG